MRVHWRGQEVDELEDIDEGSTVAFRSRKRVVLALKFVVHVSLSRGKERGCKWTMKMQAWHRRAGQYWGVERKGKSRVRTCWAWHTIGWLLNTSGRLN